MIVPEHDHDEIKGTSDRDITLIDPTLLLPTLIAAMAYTLTPGPAFLALLGIGATQGRRAGVGFLAGHLAGDVVWASLALVAIIGAQSLGTVMFDLLGPRLRALSALAGLEGGEHAARGRSDWRASARGGRCCAGSPSA